LSSSRASFRNKAEGKSSKRYLLSKLKVLDLTQFVSGPFCTQILADLGAYVVKVEKPPDGDAYRNAGPHFIDGESTLFLSLNRNKKSIGLNLKNGLSKRLFLERLIPNFDVMVENFSTGTMESLGLGYETCRSINPRIIYCSISGFGEIGPYRSKKGFDLIVQAMSGIMDLTGEENSNPVKVGLPITDFAAGLFAAVGILSACYDRDTGSNVGRKIDTSLYESSISLLSVLACDYLASGEVPRRMGSASPSFAPYQAFRARDGYLTIAGAGTEGIWHRFVKAINLPNLASDIRFKTNADRVKNQKLLEKIIDDKLSERTVTEWVTVFEREEVPCGPVNTLSEVLSNEHTKALNIIRQIPHPNKKIRKGYGATYTPINVGGISNSRYESPPLLGEHAEEVLSSVGYSLRDIHTLKEKGVVL
jgi:crotonobetainyl-CoA:carnitine CoA-transferase CaiB-like acyl-CoA transferase